MKKLRLNFLIFLSLVILLFACTQNNKSADVEADKAAIKETISQYIHGANTADLDLFISSWTDDAIRMESGYHAIIGKENLRKHFKINGFDRFKINIATYGEIDIEVSGDLAFSFVHYILSLTPKEGGSTTHFDSKVVDIYKRQKDGTWKIYIDSPSSNPTWSNESVSPELMNKKDSLAPVL